MNSPVEVGSVPEGVPFGRFILLLVTKKRTELTRDAMWFLSLALGNEPGRMRDDAEHREFLARYFEEGILAYARKAAAFQVGAFSFLGSSDSEAVFRSFRVELNKVLHVLVPDKTVAEEIREDEVSAKQFYLAILCAIAVLCQADKARAALFGLHRSLFGRWTWRGRGS